MIARKILVMKLRSMGDTVLMTAALVQVQKQFPNAEIDVAVTSDWSSLFDHFPKIRKVFTYKRHGHFASRARGIANLAMKLRREKYDCVVCLHASPSSALISFATGAKVRSVHFHGHKDKNRYSTVQIPGKGTLKPIIERDMDAVRALGVSIPEGSVPKVYLDKSEQKMISEKFKQIGLTQSSKPLLGISLGASRPTKQWPIEKYVDLAIQWCEEQKGHVLVMAGANETELVELFFETLKFKKSNYEDQIIIHNRFKVRELALALSQLNVLVTNDSGPKHLAIALDIPTVTLFGPEHPYEWHPYSKDKFPYFFIEKLGCRKDADPGFPEWCALDTCVEQNHRCMKDIEMLSVYKECIRIKN
jgi:lipopolysaccharide heptosyltransferase II